MNRCVRLFKEHSPGLNVFHHFSFCPPFRAKSSHHASPFWNSTNSSIVLYAFCIVRPVICLFMKHWWVCLTFNTGPAAMFVLSWRCERQVTFERPCDPQSLSHRVTNWRPTKNDRKLSFPPGGNEKNSGLF